MTFKGSPSSFSDTVIYSNSVTIVLVWMWSMVLHANNHLAAGYKLCWLGNMILSVSDTKMHWIRRSASIDFGAAKGNDGVNTISFPIDNQLHFRPSFSSILWLKIVGEVWNDPCMYYKLTHAKAFIWNRWYLCILGAENRAGIWWLLIKSVNQWVALKVIRKWSNYNVKIA